MNTPENRLWYAVLNTFVQDVTEGPISRAPGVINIASNDAIREICTAVDIDHEALVGKLEYFYDKRRKEEGISQRVEAKKTIGPGVSKEASTSGSTLLQKEESERSRVGKKEKLRMEKIEPLEMACYLECLT